MIKQASILILGIFSSIVSCQGQRGISIDRSHLSLARTTWESLLESEDPQELFRVYVGDTLPGPQSGIPSVVGRWESSRDSLHFYPYFSFRPGQSYILQLPNQGSIPFYILNEKASEAPISLRIFPGLDSLPANQLKLYLQFSSPMREGFAYSHVSLLEHSGQPLESPFVPLKPELWDESHTQLTLWLDPGRIKRGLGSQQHFGEVLTEGQTVALVVREGWKSRQGKALKTEVRKSFYISEYDYDSPLPETWALRSPEAHSLSPLILFFHESLDYALLQHTLTVWDSKGNKFLGTVSVPPDGTSWEFTPDSSWLPGTYEIRIETFLEDLAGNNLNRPFDLDLLENVELSKEREVAILTFEVQF
ncbi:MAG: Ig-like domain-containing protein [Bacteroidota bacterium]